MNGLSPERWQQVDALFAEALDRPPEGRLNFLRETCRDDFDLYQDVLALLESDAEAERILGESATQFAAPLLPGLEAELASVFRDDVPGGSRVGPYQILHEIGRGGMGAVYLAERDDEHFRKRVALKLVKRGMDTDEILRRFRYERQILASLEHPNIARLYDGGVTGDGRPYLVMEYVGGTTIDRYCDERKLTVDDRLKLFRSVCTAVQYAHRNLVVHRDLKPGNILVKEDGTVKLLDFGIARLLDEADTSLSVPATRTGVRVMTPEYASPEQVRGLPVTTASDVYSLGVVLYELLTGHRPFDFPGNASGETDQIILDQIPEPPSTAVTRIRERRRRDGTTESVTPDAVSGARRTSTDRLRRRLQGDLDTILLTALRKEPERRYPSAEAFLDDIKRHLDGQPVQARKDSAGYRARKFVRRHRFGVVASAVLLLLLAGFAVAMTVQQAETARERDAAQEVAAFLESLFAASDPAMPVPGRPDTLRSRDLLARGAARVEQDLANQPAVQARLFRIIGDVYRSLALYAESRPLLEEALETHTTLFGPTHPETTESRHALARLYAAQGDYDAAEPLLRQAVATRRDYGDDAALGRTLVHLANLLRERGRFEEAEQAYQEALALSRRALPPSHPQVLTILSELSGLYEATSRYDDAYRTYHEILALQRRVYGPTHPNVAATLNNLSLILRNKEEYAAAEPYAREALALNSQAYGRAHPNVATNLSNLGAILLGKGDLDGAEAAYRESLTLFRQLLGDDHPDTGIIMTHMAELMRAQGNYQEAAALYREVLERAREEGDDARVGVAIITALLANVYLDAGDYTAAETHYRDAIERLNEVFPNGHVRIARATAGLGATLTSLERYAEAEAALLEAYRLFQEQNHTPRQALERLVALYLVWDMPDKAAEYRVMLTDSPQ